MREAAELGSLHDREEERALNDCASPLSRPAGDGGGFPITHWADVGPVTFLHSWARVDQIAENLLPFPAPPPTCIPRHLP